MKDGKAQDQIERDERDIEDMRKDNALIIEPRGAKKGLGVRDLAHTAKEIDPGASQAQ